LKTTLILAWLALLLLCTFKLIAAPIAEETNNKTSEKAPELIMKNAFYYTVQDKPKFAKPIQNIQNNRSWTKRYFGGLPLKDKNIWLQVDFEVPHETANQLGLLIMMVASYDAYWDGKLIGRNGVIGDSKTSEQAGLIEYGIGLTPDQLKVGTHTLSLQVSSHHNNTSNSVGSFYIFTGEYPKVIMHSNRSAMLPLAMSGALLLLAVYCMLIYFNAIKDKCYLLFSGLCLVVFLLFIVESWRGLWGYSYDWHIPRLELILFLTSLTSLLLTSFFVHFCKLSKGSAYVVLTTNIIMQLIVIRTVSGYDTPSLILILIGILASIYCAIYAVIKKQNNAKLMLIGLLLFTTPLALNPRLYMEQYFFVSFAILIGLMLYSLTQTMKVKQKQLVQSKINASRLELELVKRQIQPHFILNTLTAVEEWIEESPKVAVKFIDALADEFRLMAQISAQPLIAMHEELQICNAHLKVMKFKDNTHFKLEQTVCNEANLIPPGIILTLLENAISHNNYQQANIIFNLTEKIENQQSQLIFSAPITEIKSFNKTPNNMINLGLGTQYIETRLTESFEDNWLLESSKTTTHWQVIITMPFITQKV